MAVFWLCVRLLAPCVWGSWVRLGRGGLCGGAWCLVRLGSARSAIVPGVELGSRGMGDFASAVLALGAGRGCFFCRSPLGLVGGLRLRGACRASLAPGPGRGSGRAG